MHPNGSTYQLMRCLPILGFSLVLYRLFTTGLQRKYVAFFRYVLVEFIRQIVSALPPFRSNAFGLFYIVSEIIVWTLCVMAVLEVYSRVLDARNDARQDRSLLESGRGRKLDRAIGFDQPNSRPIGAFAAIAPSALSC